jgi:hypothetical protein
VNWNFLLALTCQRMAKRLYARGHMISEWGSGR